jgi:glycosyltransferase involved in cell wall biosynthesis
MRILHLTDRISHRGGADQHLAGVVHAQVDIATVQVCAGRRDPGVSLPCETVRVPGLDSRTRTPCALGPIVQAFSPDVIHVHNVVNPAALEFAAERGAVMTVQDHRAFCPARGKLTADGQVCTSPMSARVCEACFDDAAYAREMLSLTHDRLTAVSAMPVTVLSDYMRTELLQVGLTADRIDVIPPFVHALDLSAEADGPPCVLFVGRLVAAKGVMDALDAWRLSEVELPLMMAGTGPLREAAEADGALVTGWVDRQRLSALYQRAAVVVMPSRWQEPFGIVGLEALSMGTPVAAYDSGGVREWHPGEGLVPWGNVHELGQAVRAAIGTAGRLPDGYSRDAQMAKLMGFYRQHCLS